MYVKLFSSILHSSVWNEPDHVRLVWITMLLLANQDGYVRGVAGAVARAAVVDPLKCREALEQLESPDLESQDQSFGGRRIEKVEGGWFILNYAKYREFKSGAGVRASVRGLRGRSSYVYYARDGARVKIGQSRNPWARIKEMRVAAPTVVLVATELGEVEVERKRHTEFAALHIAGEWFRAEEPLLSHIASLGSPGNDVAGPVVSVATVAATTASPSASASQEAVPRVRALMPPAGREAFEAFLAAHPAPGAAAEAIEEEAARVGWTAVSVALRDMQRAGATFSPHTLTAFAAKVRGPREAVIASTPGPITWCSECGDGETAENAKGRLVRVHQTSCSHYVALQGSEVAL